MNINQKAIEYLEKNEYDKAMSLFQEAVNESRNVQSLTNLAWMYSYEEGDNEAALELIKEAVCLNPSSHFPYNLLGEIYIQMEMWQDATAVLSQSIAVQPSNEAYNNLAVAKYHLGFLEEASDYFQRCAVGSGYTMYSHVKCLIELGRTTEAKSKLDCFLDDDDDDDEFVGEVQVAELYVELKCFNEAVNWFEKGWSVYHKTPDWVSRFIYSLINTNSLSRAFEIVTECIQEKIGDINDAQEDECNEGWTESDKEEHIKQLHSDKSEYERIIEQISSGYIPAMKFSTSINTSCYLFGCGRHNHPEYQK